MKHSSLLLLLFSILMLSAFPCRGQDWHCYSWAKDTVLASDPGHLICTGAAQMWEQAFKSHYSYSAQPDTPFCFSMNPDTLRSLYQPGDSQVIGVRVYFGLQDSIHQISQVPSELCLMLVPFNQYGDVPAPDSMVMMLSNSTITKRVPFAVAQSCVQNWSNHYYLEPDYIVPVFAYNFSSITLQHVDGAAANKFYFLLGCHTIGMDYLGYCLPESCRACTTTSSGAPPVARLINWDTAPSAGTIYGYAAVSLVVAAQQGNSLQRSSDFARPCPRYCGKSLFSIPQ